MQSIRCFETSVCTYSTSQCHIPEDQNDQLQWVSFFWSSARTGRLLACPPLMDPVMTRVLLTAALFRKRTLVTYFNIHWFWEPVGSVYWGDYFVQFTWALPSLKCSCISDGERWKGESSQGEYRKLHAWGCWVWHIDILCIVQYLCKRNRVFERRMKEDF